MDQTAPADQTVLWDLRERGELTQIWIAVSVYVLAAIVRKRLKLDVSLYTLMQVFSVTVFRKSIDRIGDHSNDQRFRICHGR